jgi:hypothetical protein
MYINCGAGYSSGLVLEAKSHRNVNHQRHGYGTATADGRDTAGTPSCMPSAGLRGTSMALHLQSHLAARLRGG